MMMVWHDVEGFGRYWRTADEDLDVDEPRLCLSVKCLQVLCEPGKVVWTRRQLKSRKEWGEGG